MKITLDLLTKSLNKADQAHNYEQLIRFAQVGLNYN